MKTLECTIYPNMIGFKPDAIKLNFKYIREVRQGEIEIVFPDNECVLDKIKIGKSYAGISLYNDDKTILYIFNDVIFDTDIIVGIDYCNKLTCKYKFYEKKYIN